MCAATAERFADQPAIVDGETRLTHAELFDAARRFGGGTGRWRRPARGSGGDLDVQQRAMGDRRPGPVPVRRHAGAHQHPVQRP